MLINYYGYHRSFDNGIPQAPNGMVKTLEKGVPKGDQYKPRMIPIIDENSPKMVKMTHMFIPG